MILIRDVFAKKGITPTNSQMWAVGSRVANLYKAQFGREPDSPNVRKASGRGSHRIASYPSTYYSTISTVIDEVVYCHVPFETLRHVPEDLKCLL